MNVFISTNSHCVWERKLQFIKCVIIYRGIAELIKEKGSKAALLVIHLCSVDVRMTLEQDDNEKVSVYISYIIINRGGKRLTSLITINLVWLEFNL